MKPANFLPNMTAEQLCNLIFAGDLARQLFNEITEDYEDCDIHDRDFVALCNHFNLREERIQVIEEETVFCEERTALHFAQLKNLVCLNLTLLILQHDWDFSLSFDLAYNKEQTIPDAEYDHEEGILHVADLDEDIPFVIEDTLPPHGTPEREALHPYGFN